ncbi:MAG: hypothetical protein KGH85_08575, partial [Thaumarchaeota archaeon]|nr:hypothetical protein [Nitrososphaerota archaeon]
IVDVKIGDNLTYSQSPVLLTPGIPQERKIVTTWPPVINSLITENVLDAQLHHVSFLNGKFIVKLYDINGNKIDESQVTSHGEAHFSNLKVGDYLFKAVNANDDSEWGTTKITLDGTKFSLDIVKKQIVTVPQPISPPVQSVPQPVPQTVQPAPQPIPETTQPVPKQVCNCVAFRLDNVQDYWLSNVQTQVIDAFVQKNASLTVGVIGKAFGEDSKLTDYIKSKIPAGGIDVGINGWSFEDFTAYTKSEQT